MGPLEGLGRGGNPDPAGLPRVSLHSFMAVSPMASEKGCSCDLVQGCEWGQVGFAEDALSEPPVRPGAFWLTAPSLTLQRLNVLASLPWAL